MQCNHLKILDLVKAGDLETSHKLIQPCKDELSCLIHAHIHRLGGDMDNADYWYRRARAGNSKDEGFNEEFDRLYRRALEESPNGD